MTSRHTDGALVLGIVLAVVALTLGVLAAITVQPATRPTPITVGSNP